MKNLLGFKSLLSASILLVGLSISSIMYADQTIQINNSVDLQKYLGILVNTQTYAGEKVVFQISNTIVGTAPFLVNGNINASSLTFTSPINGPTFSNVNFSFENQATPLTFQGVSFVDINGTAISAKNSGDLTISNCTFSNESETYSNNRAHAIFYEPSAGSLTIENSNFEGIVPPLYKPYGDIYLGVIIAALSTQQNKLTINQCHFINCSTPAGEGPYWIKTDLQIESKAVQPNIDIENSTFDHGKELSTAPQGAIAIGYTQEQIDLSKVIINNCIIQNYSTVYGAISFTDCSGSTDASVNPPVITGCTFKNNNIYCTYNDSCSLLSASFLTQAEEEQFIQDNYSVKTGNNTTPYFYPNLIFA